MIETPESNSAPAVRKKRRFSPFQKGLAVGVLAATVLAGGIGALYSHQASEVALAERNALANSSAKAALATGLIQVPKWQKFTAKDVFKTAVWEAFVSEANKNTAQMDGDPQHIQELKKKTVFPDLKQRIDLIEDELSYSSGASSLGFSDPFYETFFMQDINRLCDGYELTQKGADLLLVDGNTSFAPASELAMASDGNKRTPSEKKLLVEAVKPVLEAGVETYCPR